MTKWYNDQMKVKFILPCLFLALTVLIAVPVSIQAKPSPFPTPRGTGLSQAGIRACEARESAIKKRMESLTRMAKNMEEKFDKIANRVEEYYTNKVLPSGKTIANYDTLVAEIQTKKGLVGTALAKAQTDVDAFNCTNGNPKDIFKQFRADMQAVKSALKDYRTAIKNLIVAVHSVAPTSSPEPTATP